MNLLQLQSSYDRLIELASVAPRTAVTEAWLIVEAALQHASLSLPVRPRGYGLVREAFEELIKRNLLPQETNAVFDDLRKIRNNAAHAMEFDISSEEAIRYIDLATGLAAWIKSKIQ